MAEVSAQASPRRRKTRARYECAVKEMNDRHGRIRNPSSIVVEADIGRAARRHREWALLLLIAGVALYGAAQLGMVQTALQAPVVDFIELGGITLLVGCVFVLGSIFSRPSELAVFGQDAFHRVRLHRRYCEVLELERRCSADIGDLVGTIAHRETLPTVPARIKAETEEIEARYRIAVRALPAGTSAEAHADRGRRIRAWRTLLLLSLACLGFLVLLLLSGPIVALIGDSPVIEGVFALVDLGTVYFAAAASAMLLLMATAALLLDHGVEPNGSEAIAFAQLWEERTRRRAQRERYASDGVPSDEDASAQSIAWHVELTRGIQTAMRRASRRALIQLAFAMSLSVISLAPIGMLIAQTTQTYDAISERERAVCAVAVDDFKDKSRCVPAEASVFAAQRTEQYWTLFVLKLFAGVTLNALAFFFLIGYRKSQADAKFYRNELTTLEMQLLALQSAERLSEHGKEETVRRNASRALALVLARLGRSDRNPVFAGGVSNANVQEHVAANMELQMLAEYLRSRSIR